MSKEDIEKTVKENEEIAPLLEGKLIKKFIVVPKRLINIIL